MQVYAGGIGWTGDGPAAGFAIVPAIFDATPENSIEVSRTVALVDGGVRITRTWQAAAPRVPAEVTNAQARYALMQTPSPLHAGKSLFDDINAAITAAGGIDAMAWEYSNVVSRNSSLVASIGAQAGLSAEQLDDLFDQAARIAF